MSDLATVLPQVLKELNTAMKATAFYPAQHPSVVAALDRLAGTLKEAMAIRETFKVGVGDAAFVYENGPVGAEDSMLAGFAGYLSRRSIGALAFRPPLEIDSLRGLLEVLALDPGAVKSRGGPARCLAEKRLGGVSLEEFNPADTLRLARTASSLESGEGEAGGKEVSLNDLVARFLAGQDPTSPPGLAGVIQATASNEKAARDLVRSIQAIAGPAGEDAGSILASSLGRMADELASLDPGALSSLAANLGTALQDLDPEARMSLLQTSIPVNGTGLDLAREIRASIPADRMGEMIVSLVQSQQKLNPRLTSIVRKVLIDTGGSEQNRAAVLEAIKTARRPGSDLLSEVWDSIEELLEETQDQWLSRDYKSLLEMIASEAPRLDEALRREFQSLPGFVDALTEQGTNRLTWLVFSDLLDLESDPAVVCRILKQIGERAMAIRPDWYEAAAETVSAVRGLLEAVPPPAPHIHQAGVDVLQTVSRRVIGSYRENFHDLGDGQHELLARVLDALGPYAVDSLAAGLHEEGDWEVRKTFITFLVTRGREAVPGLVKRLSDPSWHLVRNVLLTLGEIGDPLTVPAIAETLKHPEPRVRRDAVTALGKIGGPRAFSLVRECLKDPEVSEVATRCLAIIDHARTVATFLSMTDRVNFIGRGNASVKEAIKTLGALGAHESIPRLQRILTRNFWLPPSAGDPVRIAAALALEKIGTQDALRALETGARLWRYPVRSVCAAIVEGRRGQSGMHSPN